MALRTHLIQSIPVTALAPMQDVTDLPFWGLMARYGGPDLYFTEYFRVTPHSKPEKYILRSITENPTGKPAIAQLIGNHIPGLIKTAKTLQKHAVSGIDLNLGCPAPVVYKKRAGGGLLRELALIDQILAALRDAITETQFTVKTRIGFENTDDFEQLLSIFAKHELDLVTIHGRTVKQMYRSDVDFHLIRKAVNTLSTPVLANGNIVSPSICQEVLRYTGAAGVMIGRGAIRNPWIFRQIREYQSGQIPFVPTGQNLLSYIRDLYESVKPPEIKERQLVHKMKKYLNFIGDGAEPTGDFLYQIRRADNEHDFFRICEQFLDHPEPLSLLPKQTQHLNPALPLAC